MQAERIEELITIGDSLCSSAHERFKDAIHQNYPLLQEISVGKSACLLKMIKGKRNREGRKLENCLSIVIML